MDPFTSDARAGLIQLQIVQPLEGQVEVWIFQTSYVPPFSFVETWNKAIVKIWSQKNVFMTACVFANPDQAEKANKTLKDGLIGIYRGPKILADGTVNFSDIKVISGPGNDGYYNIFYEAWKEDYLDSWSVSLASSWSPDALLYFFSIHGCKRINETKGNKLICQGSSLAYSLLSKTKCGFQLEKIKPQN